MKNIFFFFLFLSAFSTNSFAQTNGENQFDSAGFYHNEGLDYALENLELPIASGDDIIANVDAYFQIKGFSGMSDFLSSSSNRILAYEFENASDLSAVFSEKGMSIQFCSYYSAIDRALEDASSPEDFYSAMISLESEINSSSIEDEEKQILLSSASVYRYSVAYWSSEEKVNAWTTKMGGTVAQRYNVAMPLGLAFSLPTELIEDGLNAESKIMYTSIPFVDNNTYFVFSWKSLGKADGKGAIEGGVAGALGGLYIAGPLGGLGGAVAGGVGWGAGCSVSNAIGQLTGWW